MTVLKDATAGDEVTVEVADITKKDGSPWDSWTGWTVKFAATRWLGVPPFATKTSPDSAITLALAPAKVTVVLPPADFARRAMDGTRAASVLVHWDVEVSTASQGPYTLDSGVITVRRDVS